MPWGMTGRQIYNVIRNISFPLLAKRARISNILIAYNKIAVLSKLLKNPCSVTNYILKTD